MSNLRRAERLAFRSKPLFEPVGAVAIVTGPILRAVQVTTAAAGVRVLDLQQFEIFFPVGAFFRQRGVAITDFNPLNVSIIELPGILHIPEILVAGNRSAAERTFLNRSVERRFLTRLHLGCNQVSHP
jgi:hypothetical protein